MAIELEEQESSSFQKLLLQEVLLETQTISPDQLRQGLAELQRRRAERRAGARRLIYLTDLPNYGIVVVDSVSHEVVAQIALPRERLKGPPVFNAAEWIPFGFGGVAMFTPDNQFLAEVNWSVNEQSGLGINAESCTLVHSRLGRRGYEAATQHLTQEILPTRDVIALPLDMTVNHARDRLFVSDRGAGLIHVVDTAGNFVVGTVPVRKEGGKKGLHVAEHPQNRTLYITDNSSPRMTIVDPRGLKARQQPLQFGPLGNLVISPDGQWLYACVLRPDQPLELVILDAQRFRLKKAIPLHGLPFSLMDDPKDLLLLAPDGKTLMALTYVNEPSLFTPVINVIDAEAGELLEPLSLGNANKPTTLAWSVDQPALHEDDDRDLAEVLIEMGITTQDAIDEAIRQAEAPEEFEDVAEEEEEEEEEGEYEEEEEEDSDDFYPVLNNYDIDPATLAMFSRKAIDRFKFLPVNREGGIFTVAFVRANHEEALRIVEGRADGMPVDEIELSEEEFNYFLKFRYDFILERYLSAARQEQFMQFNLNPPVHEEDTPLAEEEESSFMELDAEEVEELLVRYLAAEFYKKTEINLRLYEDARLRLQTAAARARMELASKPQARVYLQYIYIDEDSGTTLDMDETITQALLKEMCKDLIMQKQMPAPGEEVKVIDDFTMCPNCRNMMPLGIIQCPHCQYEIVKIEPKEERKIYMGSPPLNANLSSGVVLVTDTERNRVVIIDRQLHALWHYGPEGLMETEHDHSQLRKPAWSVQLPGERTLICDTGHERVIEVDNKEKRMVRELGRDPGLPQLLLSAPVFATRLENNNTLIVDRAQHRIIEVTMLDQMVWQLGAMARAGCSEDLLNAPRYIQRLANGNNLVTDTGNHRVVELDPANQLVWQYGNVNNVMGGGAGRGVKQLNSPTMANRTTLDRTLICDGGNKRVIEVDENGTIVWEYSSEGKYGMALITNPQAAYQADEEVNLIWGPNQCIALNRQQQVVWSCEFDKFIPVEERKSETVLVIKPGAGDTELSELDERERKLAELALKASKRLKREASQELLPLELVMVDRTHNVVCVVDRAKRVTWQFGAAERDTNESLVRPHMARWLPEIKRVLIADTERHRVIMVDHETKKVTWQYGVTDAMGSGPNQLGQPRSAELLPNKHMLITDPHSNRVIEITPKKEIVWQYGGWEEGISPLGDPYYAAPLENDNRLIVDWRNHRVIEVNVKGDVVWQYGTTRQPGAGPNQLSFPEFAQRTKEGTTLICDTRNNRVIEVTPERKIIWEFKSSSMADGDASRRITNPQAAYRLENNNTVIIHSGNRQALEVDIEYKPVWSYSLMVRR